MGRPTDNPKPYQLTVKYDEECKQILTEYCEQEKSTKWKLPDEGLKS